MVPVPGQFVESVIGFLQVQSANLSYRLFLLLGVPVLRDGFVLKVPGVNIEVAKECSGINSSIALLILMIIFAHETLHSNWRRVLLILLTIPLSILKNAIRIVTLTMLSIRVDPGFLTGRLHHEGGFVFFLITLGLVFPIWKLLKMTEKPPRQSATPATVAVSASRASD
jgi:exosortase